MTEHASHISGSGGPESTPGAGTLGRELGGDLPCFVCGYNLRGLSIRSVCPECGARVRATILSIVDPRASELQPIGFPRVIATGIVIWAVGGLVAAVAIWLPVIGDALRVMGVRGLTRVRPDMTWLVLSGISFSGLGSIALIRPHRRIARPNVLAALGATLLYIPLGFVLGALSDRLTAIPAGNALLGFEPSFDGTVQATLSGLLVATIMLLLRPNARLLVARSLILRTGRVDRQTMLAMAGAAALLTVGVLLARTGTILTPGAVQDAARFAGLTILIVGATLLILGLAGSAVDCVRIARSIVFPRPTLRQLLDTHAPRPTKDRTPTPPPPQPALLSPQPNPAAHDSAPGSP